MRGRDLNPNLITHKQLSYCYASMTVKLWASQQFYISSKRNVHSKAQRGWQFFFTDKHIATDKIVSCLPRSHPHWTYNRWLNKNRFLVWKKVEEYLRLFETYGGNRFSLFLMRSLGKLICFSGRMTLRMKLIAQKELIFLFQMAPSRILWDQ